MGGNQQKVTKVKLKLKNTNKKWRTKFKKRRKLKKISHL